MAEDAPKIPEDSKDSIKNKEKLVELQKKLVELKKEELQLSKDIDKIAKDNKKGQEELQKLMNENKKSLDQVLKQKKQIQDQDKQNKKATEEIIGLEKSIFQSQSKRLASQNNINKSVGLGVTILKDANNRQEKLVKSITGEQNATNQLNKNKQISINLKNQELKISEKLSSVSKKLQVPRDPKQAQAYLVFKQKELELENKINDQKKIIPKGDSEQIKQRISALNTELTTIRKVYEEKKKTPPMPKLQPPLPVKKPIQPTTPIFSSKPAVVKPQPVEKKPTLPKIEKIVVPPANKVTESKIIPPLPAKPRIETKIPEPPPPPPSDKKPDVPKVDASVLSKAVEIKKQELDISQKINAVNKQAQPKPDKKSILDYVFQLGNLLGLKKDINKEEKIAAPKPNIKETQQYIDQKNKELAIIKKINEEKKIVPKGDGDQIKKRILDLTAELASIKKISEEKSKVPPTPKASIKPTVPKLVPPTPAKPAVSAVPRFDKPKPVLPAKTLPLPQKTAIPDKTIQAPVKPIQVKALAPKPVEVKVIQPKPIVGKIIPPKPVQVKALAPKPIQVKALAPKPVEVKALAPKPVEVKAVAPKPVEVKVIQPKPIVNKVPVFNKPKPVVKTPTIKTPPIPKKVEEVSVVKKASEKTETKKPKTEPKPKVQAEKSMAAKAIPAPVQAKESVKKPAPKPMAAAATPTPVKQAEPKQKEVKQTKPESITQEMNVEANIDTKPLDKGLTLIDAMQQSNKDDIKTLLEKNRVMTEGLKVVQQQQNISIGRKRQQREELLQLIENNKEKIVGLGIDKQSEKSILRNQKKQTKKSEASEVKKPDASKEDDQASSKTSVSNKKERNLLDQQDLNISRDIAATAEQVMKAEGGVNAQSKETVKTLSSVIKQREKIESAILASIADAQDLETLEKDLTKNAQQKLIAESKIVDIVNRQGASLQEMEKFYQEHLDAIEQEKVANDEVLAAKAKLSMLTGKEARDQEKVIKQLERKLDIASANVIAHQDLLDSNKAEYIAAKQVLSELNKSEEALKRQKKHQEDINKRMGIAGEAMKLFGGILDKFGVGSFLKMDKVLDSMRKKAEDGGSRWKVLGAGITQAFKNIGSYLSDPLVVLTGMVGIVTKLVKLATAYQSKTFEIGKDLGVSVTRAEELRTKTEALANQNGKLALTSSQILKTYQGMSDTLGMMAPENEEFLQTSTMLERRIGASAESMLELQLYSAKTGKTMMSSYASVVGAGKAEAARLKVAMSEKQILDAVSKSSATIHLNFKGSLAAMSKAVVQAQKMGLSLDKINKIGEGMLDFESSISKEMEAQLLTGKNIDLSKARQLALDGDTNGLMQELNKQIGSQAEYEKMNTIQKQAYAEALGMSKDEMDEMYHAQAKATALGALASKSASEQYEALSKQGKSHEEIAKILGDKAAEDAKSASVNEKMAATMERVQEAIGQATQKLIPTIEKVANWLSNTKNIEHVIENIITGAKVLGSLFVGWKVAQMATYISKLGQVTTEQTQLGLQLRQVEASEAQLVVMQQQQAGLTQQASTQGVINAEKQTSVGITGEQTVAESAVQAIQTSEVVTEGSKNMAKETGLAITGQTGVAEKVNDVTKKAQLGTERALGAGKKSNLITTKVQDITEKTISATKRTQIALSAVEGNKEKKNAGFSIANAIAKVTGGSGMLGPGALIVGGLAATMLFGYLSSVGGDSGGGSAPSAASIVPASSGGGEQPKIDPMNQAAETKKVLQNTALAAPAKDVQRGGNTSVYVNVDPITGQKVVKTITDDYGVGADRSKVTA